MSLNTCCFPRIRFPFSIVLYLFTQARFSLNYWILFVWRFLATPVLFDGFLYILLIYNSISRLFLFFGSFCFDVFLNFYVDFSFYILYCYPVPSVVDLVA